MWKPTNITFWQQKPAENQDQENDTLHNETKLGISNCRTTFLSGVEVVLREPISTKNKNGTYHIHSRILRPTGNTAAQSSNAPAEKNKTDEDEDATTNLKKK